jgi:hypothetical protein
MIKLTEEFCAGVIEEITGSNEVGRRALQKRRHDIYKDGGKAFLIEQILREFDQDALKEMRLAPINLLKKIINKRSAVYKKPPVRIATNESDQKLVDHYVEKLKLNQVMQKANRYYTLFSNTVIYTFPKDGEICTKVVPPYLYSLKSDEYDKTIIKSIIFNAFIEDVTPIANVPSATGAGNFSQQKGQKSLGDKVDSGETESDLSNRRFIFWTDQEHQTRTGKGELVVFDEEAGEEQFLNPIQRLPIVNAAKDRDNELWASQGEDLVDLTIAIQTGWTDILTIAKNQGFSILTIVSEEEPKKLQVGINKAVWLKAKPGGEKPSISYVQAQSPLSEYKELLMDLLGLLLSTNDMDPQSIGGSNSTRSFTSGFHALIAMSDNLEAIEADKPAMLDAERDQWDVIVKWHNYMFDVGVLNDESRALGKFKDDFEISIQYAEIKPLESEDEVLNREEKKLKLGLTTKRDALKKLYPDITEKQLDEKLIQIETELKSIRELMKEETQPENTENPSSEEQQPEEGQSEEIEAEEKQGEENEVLN